MVQPKITIWQLDPYKIVHVPPARTACIADLLGERARAMGCRCPCGKCGEQKAEGRRQPVRDFKMAQANDMEAI